MNSVEDQVRAATRAQASAMRAVAVEEGMIPLRLYGWNKVIGGLTTVEEVVRVTASDLEMSDE